jgi:release factor glutamine methyltransferase
VLGVDPGRLILMGDDRLDPASRDRFDKLVRRRAAREPVSHLTGRRLFYGRDFAVGPDVLDPRPETETLISAALATSFATVLDLGTGSGAIVLTLLAERPLASGVGTDLSARALAVAADNAHRLGVAERCALVQSDWFAGVAGRFDLVVSNPPYIAAVEMPGLAPELAHEPRMALTDEGDGLGAYRAIAAGVRDHLAPGGRVLLEVGPTQAAAVAALLHRAGLGDIAVLPDMDGRERVVVARRGENATESGSNRPECT